MKKLIIAGLSLFLFASNTSTNVNAAAPTEFVCFKRCLKAGGNVDACYAQCYHE